RIAIAKGDTQRFNLILAQYQVAPGVTHERLWLETMEDVLAGTRKVVDSSNGRNLLYLPIAGSATPSKLPAAGVAAAASDDASVDVPDTTSDPGSQP
ncbi:MAG: protease modulator HflK, partial [Xanthomonadales bacterium]|nr:protease modulator HflK [Xanthomonadales bacterium]